MKEVHEIQLVTKIRNTKSYINRMEIHSYRGKSFHQHISTGFTNKYYIYCLLYTKWEQLSIS